MDPAVALVQCYLRLNGFFTETEYPVVGDYHGLPQVITDVDVLAVRFPGAARWIPGSRAHGRSLAGDPLLQVTDDRMDMIIGEVKEGKSQLNGQARSLPVLEAVIRRFGCCFENPTASARQIFEGRKAETILHGGLHCRARVVVFGGRPAEFSSGFEVISLQHIARFVSEHLTENTGIYSHAQFKEDTMGMFALLAKLGLHVR
jgi:hypothetical protein